MSPASRECECAPFKAAQERGSDNENYGALVYKQYHDGVGPWRIGTELPPIEFCPWCGKSVPK